LNNPSEFQVSDDQDVVSYQQWRTVRNPHDETKKITAKVTVRESKKNLVTAFLNGLPKFKRHIFNIYHQFSMCRDLRLKLESSECIMHIDFSENYAGQFSSEIQSVHFGGSHQPISLHTGVIYHCDVDEPLPFCSVSACTRHDPGAIWIHLEPVFGYVHDILPDVEIIHFLVMVRPLSTETNSTSFSSHQSFLIINFVVAPGTSGKPAMGRGHQME
jgi:hypothetical protein